MGLDRMKAVDVMACLKGLLGQRGGGAFGQESFHLESGRRLRTKHPGRAQAGHGVRCCKTMAGVQGRHRSDRLSMLGRHSASVIHFALLWLCGWL